MNNHAVRRAVLAGAFLVGSAIVPSRIDACGLELQVNPGAIPRDTVSTATATATVSPPRAGVQVTFSIFSGPGTLDPTSAVTDGLGEARTTVKASSIAEGEAGTAAVRIRASASGETADAWLIVRGLNMTLVSAYSKVYIGNPTYRKNTVLTCTVKDTASVAAQGQVGFSTDYGSVSPATATLNAGGVASSTLSPGEVGCVNSAYSSLGPITKSVQVTFAIPSDFEAAHEPHKKTSETGLAAVKFFDQDGEYFPGCEVKFHWTVPSNQDVTYTYFASIPEAFTQSTSPTPTAEGDGTCQPYTPHYPTPTFLTRFTLPQNWNEATVRPQGRIITVNWTSNGESRFTFSVDIIGAVEKLIKLLQ